MSGGDESTKIQPESVLQTAQGVATTLGQASAPGPVPLGTGVSPIDGAASAASGTVIGLVSAASADLAPRAGRCWAPPSRPWLVCKAPMRRTQPI